MTAIGAIMMSIVAIGGFGLAQFFFNLLTGRMFWRAMLPIDLRIWLAPTDTFRMDPYHHLEEWAALLLLGAFLSLPLIALDTLGFFTIFR